MNKKQFDVCKCENKKAANDRTCGTCAIKTNQCNHCGNPIDGIPGQYTCNNCIERAFKCAACRGYYWAEDNKGMCPFCGAEDKMDRWGIHDIESPMR